MKSIQFFLVLIPLVLSNPSWAHGHDSSPYCQNRPANQELLQLESATGGTLTLDFGEEPSLATSTATLCTTPALSVTDAILWMPGMGHGSAPTTVTALPDNPGCFEISDIDFLMPGHWQVKIQITGQEEEIFDVCI